jgi:hypothetical protein
MSKAPVDETQIREVAYRLWQEEGQPEGRDQDHWSKAIETLTPAEAEVPAPSADKAPVKARAKAPRKTAAKTAVAKDAKPKAPAKPRKPKAKPE